MTRLSALRPVHLALGIPWIVAAVSAMQPIRDNSFLWHITAGAEQARVGSVLQSDPFSFTRFGEPWRTQSWLVDLGYSFAESASGLGFVPWMLALVSVGIFAVVLLIAYRESASIAATALVGIASAWIGAAFLSPRPVLFSYLLFGLVVLIVRDHRILWALPLVLWVWASLHASFPIAFLYLAVEAWRRRERQLVVPTVIGGVACLLTAHGTGLIGVLWGFVESRGALDLITEWATPNLVSFRFLPVVPALLLFVVGAQRGLIGRRDLLVIGPLLVFLLTASRAVFPAWIGLVPFMATSLEGLWPSAEAGEGSPVMNAALGLAIAVVPFALAGETSLDDRTFPTTIAADITSSRLFHDDVVGGYLIYNDRGERRVFVDDRAELYGEEFFSDVIETRSGTPTWREVFHEWEIDQALLSEDDALVVVLLDQGWSTVARSESFVLLEMPG